MGYFVMCNGAKFTFHERLNAQNYANCWRNLGHRVSSVREDNVSKAQELKDLQDIRGKFEDAKLAIADMESIVGMGDSTGELEDALKNALIDLQGYIDARQQRFEVYLMATESNPIYKTGTIVDAIGDFPSWFAATRKMEEQRREFNYKYKTGNELYYVGIREKKDRC